MTNRKRKVDVIDVNRLWSIWVGSRRGVAYWIGFIHAPDRLAALRAARVAHPNTRIGFVEDASL